LKHQSFAQNEIAQSILQIVYNLDAQTSASGLYRANSTFLMQWVSQKEKFATGAFAAEIFPAFFPERSFPRFFSAWRLARFLPDLKEQIFVVFLHEDVSTSVPNIQTLGSSLCGQVLLLLVDLLLLVLHLLQPVELFPLQLIKL